MCKLFFVTLVVLMLGDQQFVLAQDLEKLYNDSVRSRDHQKSEKDDVKSKYLQFFESARKEGVIWKCKNYFTFYDGYVFVGNKPDASDIGFPPFNFIGISSTVKDYIKFSFPALPYENQFELNTTTNQMVSYKKTLNKLEREECQKLSK
jgi:hypothetical protein